jgi:hypothetical protein
MEHGYRDEQTHSNAKPTGGSVEEQLETIQDDVNLLKIEIKQTLVDLREFILNSQTGFLSRTNGAQQSPGPPRDDPANSRSREKGIEQLDAGWQVLSERPERPPVHRPVDSGGPGGRDFRDNRRDGSRGASSPNSGYDSPAESSRRRPEPADQETHQETLPGTRQETLNIAREIGEIDVEMLVKLLAWLDSIKGKGISAEQVGPFLQAYEAKGTLTATMSTIILQSIRAIGAKSGGSGGAEFSAEFSSEEYLGYLQQLHGIVCGGDQGRISSSNEPLAGVRRIKAGPEAQA